MNEEDAAYVIKRVATAVSHMHSMGYMHFDLKAGNILINLNKDGKVQDVKIVDFGLTTNKIENLEAGIDTNGTLVYMAPEMLCANSTFGH